MENKKIKILRVIFRTFDDKLFTKRYNFITSCNIWLTKLITIPLFYDGFEYDHVELLTPQKQRVSIRMEKEDKYSNIPTVGVYCLKRDGFDNVNKKNYKLEKSEQRYKLIFGFEITDRQEMELNTFINKHLGQKYSLYNANVNVLIQKLKKPLDTLTCKFGSTILKPIDEYSSPRKQKRWDCVTLIMRILHEIGIIPEFRKSGKKISLLGLSSFDMAMLLLDMYRNRDLPSCVFVISNELQEEHDYKKGIETFYNTGSRVTRKDQEIIIE